MSGQGLFTEYPKHGLVQCSVCKLWVSASDPSAKLEHCDTPGHRAMLLWRRPGNSLGWSFCLEQGKQDRKHDWRHLERCFLDPSLASGSSTPAEAKPSEAGPSGTAAPASSRRKRKVKKLTQGAIAEKQTEEAAACDSEMLSFDEFLRLTEK